MFICTKMRIFYRRCASCMPFYTKKSTSGLLQARRENPKVILNVGGLKHEVRYSSFLLNIALQYLVNLFSSTISSLLLFLNPFFLFCLIKGQSHKVFEVFWFLYFPMASFDFWQAFQSFEAFYTQKSRRFLESPRWINKCWQPFLEISYFNLGETLTRCKFVSVMNLQIIIIIGEILTYLADFCPFISVSLIESPRNVWTNHKHMKFVKQSQRFKKSL